MSSYNSFISFHRHTFLDKLERRAICENTSREREREIALKAVLFLRGVRVPE